MIAFEVYVNKLKVCTAGSGDLETVMCSLMLMVNPDRPPDERRLTFSVSGIGDKKVYNWVHYNMLVGNRIEIRIVDTEKVDEPKQLRCQGGECAT